MKLSLIIAFTGICLCACQEQSFDSKSSSMGGIAKGERQVGVRNFRELKAAMSILTGVGKDNKEVEDSYKLISSMLPLNNSADALSAPAQIGVFRLASGYCNQLFSNEKYQKRREILFPDIDFTAPLEEVFAQSQRRKVAYAFIEAFYLTASAERESDGLTADRMVKFIGEALGETKINTDSYYKQEGSTIGSTKDMAVCICTAMLASAPLVFY